MSTRAGKEVEHDADTSSVNDWSDIMLKHFDEGFMLYEENMGLADAVSPTSWSRDIFISNYIWDQCEGYVAPGDVRKQVDSIYTLRVLPPISRITSAPTRKLFVPILERDPLVSFKIHFRRPTQDNPGHVQGRIVVSLPSLLSVYTTIPVLYRTMRADFWKGNRVVVLTIHSRWYIEYGQFIFNEHNDRRRDPRFVMAPQRDSPPSIYYTYTVAVPRKDVAKWITESTVVKLRLTYSEQSFVSACLLGKVTYCEKSWARSIDILLDIQPPGPDHQVGTSGPVQTGPLFFRYLLTPRCHVTLNQLANSTDIYTEVRPRYPEQGMATGEGLASTSALATQVHDARSEWSNASYPIPLGGQERESTQADVPEARYTYYAFPPYDG
ncbi:hypothetical protein DFP72DRAFT_946586 [Ephemerocybe angulata]|uniref:Uncharacterized protein n=1 Tax=Ephemerocybe angulata TaxID=980116 RepID=A0A8H6H727_9AGAR|nr:hypothetical protein DFP72DRAFT_946586 [Tulosesus angulatus]